MSTARTAHVGATHRNGAHRMPRRLSPRRTARLMGIRVTPRVHEITTGIMGTVTFLACIIDPDGDPTSWTPAIGHIARTIMGG